MRHGERLACSSYAPGRRGRSCLRGFKLGRPWLESLAQPWQDHRWTCSRFRATMPSQTTLQCIWATRNWSLEPTRHFKKGRCDGERNSD